MEKIKVNDTTYIYVEDGGWHGAVIFNEKGDYIAKCYGECFDYSDKKIEELSKEIKEREANENQNS